MSSTGYFRERVSSTLDDPANTPISLRSSLLSVVNDTTVGFFFDQPATCSREDMIEHLSFVFQYKCSTILQSNITLVEKIGHLIRVLPIEQKPSSAKTSEGVVYSAVVRTLGGLTGALQEKFNDRGEAGELPELVKKAQWVVSAVALFNQDFDSFTVEFGQDYRRHNAIAISVVSALHYLFSHGNPMQFGVAHNFMTAVLCEVFGYQGLL